MPQAKLQPQLAVHRPQPIPVLAAPRSSRCAPESPLYPPPSAQLHPTLPPRPKYQAQPDPVALPLRGHRVSVAVALDDSDSDSDSGPGPDSPQTRPPRAAAQARLASPAENPPAFPSQPDSQPRSAPSPIVPVVRRGKRSVAGALIVERLIAEALIFEEPIVGEPEVEEPAARPLKTVPQKETHPKPSLLRSSPSSR
jgi:hypothetical protein